MEVCSIEGCTGKRVAKDLCERHYRRLKRQGTTDKPSRLKHRKCSIEGCDKPHDAKGYCASHYFKLKRFGDPLHAVLYNNEKDCSVEGCSSKQVAKGYCDKHHHRYLKHGDASITLKEYKNESQEALEFYKERLKDQDSADECIEWPYSKSSKGYSYINSGAICKLVHRSLLLEKHGLKESPLIGCHSCGNPGCVNLKHLRLDTCKSNTKDRREHGTHGWRLNEQDVVEILKSTEKYKTPAERYGVCLHTIKDVRARRTWKWVKV